MIRQKSFYMMIFFSQKKRTAFIRFRNVLIFTVTFDQYHAALLYRKFYFQHPKHLNGSIFVFIQLTTQLPGAFSPHLFHQNFM